MLYLVMNQNMFLELQCNSYPTIGTHNLGELEVKLSNYILPNISS